MKHFWQFLIIVISWKYGRRRPIWFVMAPCVGVFYSPAIFAVLHWSFVFKHWTLLCCLILVTISVWRKSKGCSFWWRSYHEVNTSQRCVLDDQWWRYSNILVHTYPDGWSPYSRTRIWVSVGTTRVCGFGWIWVKTNVLLCCPHGRTFTWQRCSSTKLAYSFLSIFVYPSACQNLSPLLFVTLRLPIYLQFSFLDCPFCLHLQVCWGRYWNGGIEQSYQQRRKRKLYFTSILK